MKTKGTIKRILEPETFTRKDGTPGNKAIFVLTTSAKYNPDICFEVLNDKGKGDLSNINVGDEVEIEFNLSSREFNGKWYHSVSAWKITKAEVIVNNEEEDLPF